MKGMIAALGSVALVMVAGGLGLGFLVNPGQLVAPSVTSLATTGLEQGIRAGLDAAKGKPGGNKPAEEKPASGKPVDGKTSDGKAPDGKGVEGKSPDGKPAHGAPSGDTPTDGKPREKATGGATASASSSPPPVPLPPARPLAVLLSPQGVGPALSLPTTPPPPDMLGADGKPLAAPEAPLPPPWSVEVGLYATQARAQEALTLLRGRFPAVSMAVWADSDQKTWFSASIPSLRPQQADSLARTLRSEGFNPVAAVPAPPPSPPAAPGAKAP